MFLIAKIVRGRRLLHQLEQEVEREKAARALEQREKLLFNSRAMPDQAADELGASSSACPYAVGGAGGEAAAAISAGGDMELPEMGQEMTKAALDQQQLEQIRRRRQRAAVRQRTDSSLPSEDADQLLGSKSEQAMRRTSSMPSIVESGEQISHHHRHQLHHNLSIYPRRGPRPVRHYNYEDKLTKLQKRALRFTWQRLLTRNGGKRIENVFEEVFERMMRSLPIMREMFNTRTFISAMSRCEIASPRDHARLIVKMFEAAIKNLEMEPSKRTDTESDFDPKLLGQAHSSLRPYGFTSTLWEAFGEAVIDIVLNQEAVRDLPGASQAWVVLTACMVDQLRAGFESVRECPFKNMRSQKEGQQNGGGQMESGGRVSSPSNLPEESCQSPQRQLGEGLHRLNTARRRTITAADQEGLLEQGQHTLSGDGHPFQQPCARERRCFSIMPLNSAADGSSASAHHHSRVQLKFLQDMASTEL